MPHWIGIGTHLRKTISKSQIVLRLCQRTKKDVEDEGNCDSGCNWRVSNGSQRLCKGVRSIRNQRAIWGRPSYMFDGDKNPVKNPGHWCLCVYATLTYTHNRILKCMNMYVYTHTHTHTHTYIYIYIYVGLLK